MQFCEDIGCERAHEPEKCEALLRLREQVQSTSNNQHIKSSVT